MAVHHGGEVGAAAKKLASSKTGKSANLLRARHLLGIRLRDIAKERRPITL